MKKKYITILFFCITYNNYQKDNNKLIKKIIPSCNSQINFQKQTVNIIPIPPKMQKIIDWEKKISLVIHNMLLASTCIREKKDNNTLFVNFIENTSDYTLEIKKITYILINLLTNIQNQFTVINSNISNDIYENLKLFNNNFTSRGKAIKIGRYINAKYILHCVIFNDLKGINLEVELILVRNGEMIWSNIIPI